MKFAVVIHAAPYTSAAPVTALRFCEAALRQGHEITRLFFYRDGVRNVDGLAVAPQDELDVTSSWADLIRDNSLDAVACVSSALKRGVLDAREAHRHDKSACNLIPGVTIAGLGQLVDATLISDRVINFG